MNLNFFARIYLAITDFRLYPFIVQKEKFIHALLYFLGFILLVSAILATGVTVKILNLLNDFMLIYNTQVQDFTISDGKLDIDENINIEFDKVQIYADDTININDFKIDEFNIKQNFFAVALKDGVILGSKSLVDEANNYDNPNQGVIIVKYDNLETNKDDLYNTLNFSMTSAVFKLSLAGAILCGVFVAYLAIKFIHVIFVAFALLFLGLVFKTKYKFTDYLKVAFYVITLPVIIEVIALIVTGEIGSYANITYFLLMYVYMYYAIRALKLDNIIMSTQQKLMGLKLDVENLNKKEDASKEEKNEEENNKDNKNSKKSKDSKDKKDNNDNNDADNKK